MREPDPDGLDLVVKPREEIERLGREDLREGLARRRIDLHGGRPHRPVSCHAGVAGPFDLAGKRALVTGGSRGIGRAIAFALANAGADVAITSRKGDDAEPVAREIRAKRRRSLALLLEVRNAPSIRVCFERLGREWGSLAILVNNAGTNVPQDLSSLDETAWDTVVDTNLKGVASVTKAALDLLA